MMYKLLLLLLCSGNIIEAIQVNDQFDSYCNSFSQIKVPLVLDRTEVFQLSRNLYSEKKQKFPVITEAFSRFIPSQISKNLNINNFRMLYKIYSDDNEYCFLIAKDYFEDNEQRGMKLFLITYSKQGKYLDCIHTAGYFLDDSEKFMVVTSEKVVSIVSYDFLHDEHEYDDSLYSLSETKSKYLIVDGEFNKMESNLRKGYFKSDSNGYTFVK